MATPIRVSAARASDQYARVDAMRGPRASRFVRTAEPPRRTRRSTGPVVLPRTPALQPPMSSRSVRLRGRERIVTETHVERVTVSGLDADELSRATDDRVGLGRDAVSTVARRLRSGSSSGARLRPHANFRVSTAKRAYARAAEGGTHTPVFS
jgi:hypothetical protein